MLLENGTYAATVRDVHLYERGEQKRLTAAFKLEAEGKEIVHREWLELNDGTISEKTLARLREVFTAWDGSIEALDDGACCRDVEVEIVVENEQDQQDSSKTWTRVRWMNPPGGGAGNGGMPDRVDRGSLVSRYGSKFRALAGGTRPVATNADAKKAAVDLGLKPASSLPPPAKKPAADTPAESSLEECWELACKRRAGKPRAEVEAAWFKVLDAVCPGKDAADLTPAEWGRIKGYIADDLPF